MAWRSENDKALTSQTLPFEMGQTISFKAGFKFFESSSHEAGGGQNSGSSSQLMYFKPIEYEAATAVVDEAVRATEVGFQSDMVKAMTRLHSFKAL